MADLGTIAGAGGASLLVVLTPKAVELVRTWIARRADVQIAETKAQAARHEREASQRIEMIRAQSEDLSVGERMVLDRAEDHRECRKEVAELRTEVTELRESVASCEAKHDAAQTMIDWLTRQIERLDRTSNRPPEPAE